MVKGLNFSINPGRLNYADYCINFETLFKDILFKGNLKPYDLGVVKLKLKDLALSSFNQHNYSPNKNSNLTKEEFDCLKALSNKKDIVIQKSDKGNAI